MTGTPIVHFFQIDTADQVARAYNRKTPKYPALPETVGLALVLLVNRNVAPDYALPYGLAADFEDFTDALCLPAEAFARALADAGASSGQAWRGGAGHRSFPAGSPAWTPPWPPSCCRR